MQLLEAVGFTASNGALCLTADADLALLNAALARLRRVADNKGHSGEAEFFPKPMSGGSSHGGAAGDVSPLLVGDIEDSRVPMWKPDHQCCRRWQEDNAVADPRSFIRSCDRTCAAAAYAEVN